MQSAWDVSTGGSTVVAVIDTGADLTHPDLRDNLWRNPREIPGNGIDDDGNGFVDDVNGADFVNRDGDPSDDNGHGTHVTGILAARGGNRVGVTGVAQRARLMVLKALGADAVGSAQTMAEAVRYAVANGAKVINMSVSGPGRSQAFEEAVQAASDAGVIMTVAAGNSGHDLDVQPEYPASFPASHVLAVAATGRTGKLIGISNRGVGTVDIAAPGQGIVSTAKGGDYEIRTGTLDGLPARRRRARAARLRPRPTSAPTRCRRRCSARPAGASPYDRHARRRRRDAPGGLRRPLAQRVRGSSVRAASKSGQGQAPPATAPAEPPRGCAETSLGAMVRRGVDLTTFIFMMLVLKLPLGRCCTSSGGRSSRRRRSRGATRAAARSAGRMARARRGPRIRLGAARTPSRLRRRRRAPAPSSAHSRDTQRS